MIAHTKILTATSITMIGKEDGAMRKKEEKKKATKNENN